MSCDECGDDTSKLYEFNHRKLCKNCHVLLNFFHIFFYEQRVKIFVDAFESKEKYYINILVFDFINEDFITRTVVSKSQNLHDAKYDAVLFICQYIEDAQIQFVTIYTDYKILVKHVSETYKVRSPGLKKKFRSIEPLLKKGLKIEYVEPQFNMARMSPQLFRFYHVFEDYDRKVSFQYKKGEEFEIMKEE